MSFEVILIVVFTTINCALIGNILILRNMAMITDAISHSILLGIVVTYFFTLDISSPLQILGATISGFLLVVIIEALYNSHIVKKDAAIGIIFPLFFSLGVILISLFASDVHLDQDVVLEGNLVFTIFDRVTLFGFDIPKALFTSFVIFLVNILFVGLLYKELKITIFDPLFASTLGYRPILLHYMTMLLLSLNTVMAFESVGSVLVISLFILAPATMLLFNLKFLQQFILSSLLGVCGSISGYFFAWYFDLSIAGSIVFITTLIFIASFLLNKQGIILRSIWYVQSKIDFHINSLLVHLSQHEGSSEELEECDITNIFKHLNWNKKYTQKVIEKAKTNDYIYQDENILYLSDLGKEIARMAIVGKTKKMP